MIRLRYLLPVIALLALVPFIVQAKEPIRTEEGVVRSISDGDTLSIVTKEGTKLKIRLYGIDARKRPSPTTRPESCQSRDSHTARRLTGPWRARCWARE